MKGVEKIIVLLFLLNSQWGDSQVLVGNRIDLVSANPADRKVSGLNAPSDEKSATNFGFFISGKVHFCNATLSGTDTLNLSISPVITNLVPGTLITFISSFTNSARPYIHLDSITGYIELTKKGIQPLDSADITSGMLVTAVYDGSRFQCISELAEQCPIGFVKATSEYCIKKIESDSSYYWNAMKVCGDMTAHVCNWGEWYYACLNAATLGITDMTNNFEWIDGGGNSLGWTIPATSNTGFMGGDASCTNIMASIVDTTHTHSRARPKTFHCCYSLK